MTSEHLGSTNGVHPLDHVARYSAAWLTAALPAFLIITLLWLDFGETMPFAYVGIGALALSFPVVVRRLNVPRRINFVYFLLVAGLLFSVVSIVTGWGNGLTDEPFTTPRFAGWTLSGHNPYTEQLVFTYIQYGKEYSSASYYLYLPLLMFLQIPGISYKWFTLACWALMVLLARKRFDTAILLAQPYVVILAASGYNDLPVLLLLTLGFLGYEGRRQKWAEYLSLGCKQFANIFVVAYYLVRRRWLDSAIAIGVTALFIAPFVVWGGPVVLCRAVLADRLSICPSGGSATLLFNYPVWLVWVFAVFWVPLLAILASWSRRPTVAARLARWNIDRRRVDRLPALVIVGGSAVAIGLTFFAAGLAVGGASPAAAIASGSLGVLAAIGWSLGWNGPWRRSPSPRPGGASAPGPPRNRVLWSQVTIAIIAFGVLAGGVLAGFSPLGSVSLGLSLGVLVGSVLVYRWDLLAPIDPAARPANPGGTTTSAR